MESRTLTLNNQLQSLREKLTAQGVKYCIGAYVDLHGVPKGKVVPIEHFAHFAHGSELYTGYALDGLGQRPMRALQGNLTGIAYAAVPAGNPT